jgi:hypothetical protein
MSDENNTPNTSALTLPEEGQFRRDVAAINKFQQIVHSTLVNGQDYGVIPGTNKPTLLKPGAEKIAKLLGLADSYEIMDRQEDWIRGFFRYIIKCRLTSVSHGVVISEGMGECNSMESKYRWRWLSGRDIPAGTDTSKLVSKTRGDWTTYRFDNDDIYSQVNTLLKMAKKRALVDAALSAGRLSEVFTQDVEDLADNGKIIEGEVVNKSTGEIKPTSNTCDHFCKEHNTKFFKTFNMRSFGHPMKDANGNEIKDDKGKTVWCHEHSAEPAASAQTGEIKAETTTSAEDFNNLQSASKTIDLNAKASAATLADIQVARESKAITQGELLTEANKRFKVATTGAMTEGQAREMLKWCADFN